MRQYQELWYSPNQRILEYSKKYSKYMKLQLLLLLNYHLEPSSSQESTPHLHSKRSPRTRLADYNDIDDNEFTPRSK